MTGTSLWFSTDFCNTEISKRRYLFGRPRYVQSITQPQNKLFFLAYCHEKSKLVSRRNDRCWRNRSALPSLLLTPLLLFPQNLLRSWRLGCDDDPRLLVISESLQPRKLLFARSLHNSYISCIWYDSWKTSILLPFASQVAEIKSVEQQRNSQWWARRLGLSPGRCVRLSTRSVGKLLLI